MIVLAEMFGIHYYMEGKEGPYHVVLVKDTKTNHYARVLLETRRVLESSLDRKTELEALSNIKDFKQEFLDYYQSFRLR